MKTGSHSSVIFGIKPFHYEKSCWQLFPEHVHLVVEEDEVHLHEDEHDEETGSEDVEYLPACHQLVAMQPKSK